MSGPPARAYFLPASLSSLFLVFHDVHVSSLRPPTLLVHDVSYLLPNDLHADTTTTSTPLYRSFPTPYSPSVSTSPSHTPIPPSNLRPTPHFILFSFQFVSLLPLPQPSLRDRSAFRGWRILSGRPRQSVWSLCLRSELHEQPLLSSLLRSSASRQSACAPPSLLSLFFSLFFG